MNFTVPEFLAFCVGPTGDFIVNAVRVSPSARWQEAREMCQCLRDQASQPWAFLKRPVTLRSSILVLNDQSFNTGCLSFSLISQRFFTNSDLFRLSHIKYHMQLLSSYKHILKVIIHTTNRARMFLLEFPECHSTWLPYGEVLQNVNTDFKCGNLPVCHLYPVNKKSLRRCSLLPLLRKNKQTTCHA